MRRIAFLLLGLCLTTGFVGCKDDAVEDDTKTTTTTTEGDADDNTTEEGAEAK